MHRYKNLDIWKRSRLLCSKVYAATSSFPDSEKFGITNQLRRASVSVPSNIAEGASRRSNKDFGRFLEIAIGSLNEIETQILISNDLGFIGNEDTKVLLDNIESVIKMTSKFKSTLKY